MNRSWFSAYAKMVVEKDSVKKDEKREYLWPRNQDKSRVPWDVAVSVIREPIHNCAFDD